MNSSNVSSWCAAEFRHTVVLKLRLEPATKPGMNDMLDRVGATGRFARKKVLEGPREATRRSDMDDIFFY